jgi:hypothetical protein
MLRPSGEAVSSFEDVNVATQNLQEYLAKAEETRLRSLAYLLGDPAAAEPIVAEIERFNQMRAERSGAADEEVLAQRERVEQMLLEAGGYAGQQISRGYAERSRRLLDAQAHAALVKGQAAAYKAAPELYRQREEMRVLRQQITDQRVFLLGIDPSRVDLDVELKERVSSLTPIIQESTNKEGPQR